MADTTEQPAAEQKPETQAPPELVALQTKLALLERQASDRVKADVDAEAARKKKLVEDGDLKGLLAAAQKEVETLKALTPDAELGREYRERETKRIDAAKTALSPSVQVLIDAQPTVALKAALLDELTKSSSADVKKAADVPKNQGAGAGTSAIDFAAASADPVKWAEAKARDPKGATEWFAAQARGGSRPVSFQQSRTGA